MPGRSALTSLAAVATGAALIGCLIASASAVRHALRGVRDASSANSALVPAVLQTGSARPDEKPPTAPLAGLDLARMASDAAGLVAPTEAGTAHLTVDPELQRIALGIMSAHHLPEGAVVLMDVATGKLLAYASHVDKGPARDLCAEATAPSASVFKIVTAAALLEDAHLGPDTQQCYSGGESRINAADLVDDPRRDRWCTTLAGAMGRSINTVFARLAGQRLAPPQLEAMARRFGYGEGVPFDVPVQPSALHVPTEPLEFARTAAGFWNTTLSPMQAAELSATVARGGEAVRPSIVERVVSPAGAVVWTAPAEPASHRAVARETAEALTTMMAHTVSEGTSWRAFHDPRGTAFLPGIEVAGKTGTLTDNELHRYYTWFTGFAPARSPAGQTPAARQVAVAALVVNGPNWQVKANLVAREMLRAYFASQGVEGVTRPSIAEVARHTRAHAP
ncbi:MAG TPA: penicillin-binding transpeptidase domain-containing protein [Polyangiaceae bacterium]|nr:penicillin-binding transpeptidase domain-containing protein [Polyangiaceae bacterium]